ncbi:MAG: S9 family peptidase, partial [Muribaculaceae bacterium]|nr:S9 family peptidase [Muribaculaceae bacterium]
MASMALAMLGSCKGNKYPAAPSDNTTDEYFGMEVADPYRPLENDTAEATLAWVEAERKVTEDYLGKIPFREALRKRIARFNDYRKQGIPSKGEDGRYYFYLNDGLKNQSVLYRSDSIGGKAEVFLDPNTLSDDGTVALTGISMSNDGRYTAYT